MEFTNKQMWSMLRSGSYDEFMKLLPQMQEGYRAIREDCIAKELAFLESHPGQDYTYITEDPYYTVEGPFRWKEFIYRDSQITIDGVNYNVLLSVGSDLCAPYSRQYYVYTGTMYFTLLLTKEGDPDIYITQVHHEYEDHEPILPTIRIEKGVEPLRDHIHHLQYAKDNRLEPRFDTPYIRKLWDFVEILYGYIRYNNGEHNIEKYENIGLEDCVCGTYDPLTHTWSPYEY
jgi:hypothetical protein